MMSLDRRTVIVGLLASSGTRGHGLCFLRFRRR
jgi:hypothetical protein